MKPTNLDALINTIAANHGLTAHHDAALFKAKRKPLIDRDDEENLLQTEETAQDAPQQLAYNDAGLTASDAPLQLAQAETDDAGAGGAGGGTVAAGEVAATDAAAGAAAGTAAAAGGISMGTLALGALAIGGIAIAAGGGGGSGSGGSTGDGGGSGSGGSTGGGEGSGSTGGGEGSGSTGADTTAPTATMTAASIANNGYATVQSSETGIAYLVRNTLTVNSESDITGAADAKWNSVTIATANSDTSLSVAGLEAGVYKLYTVDAAGNLSAKADNTVVVTNTTDANKIDLTDAGVAGDEAQLIAPVYVEGHWYYYWDRSGDGTNADSGSLNGGKDYTTHDVLDGIFTQDINGNSNPNPGTDTTDTYRYATLNGVALALPKAGETPLVTGAYRPGTAVADGATTNATYDDLLAIWDAHNGSTTGTNINGTPAGWHDTYYWSATPSASGHASVGLLDGYVFDDSDTIHNNVALEVL